MKTSFKITLLFLRNKTVIERNEMEEDVVTETVNEVLA